MKKQKFLFGALTALAMGAAFTACSDDPVNDGIDNGKVEKDQTRYLSVALSTPTAGGRAAADAPTGTFDDGAAAESAIKELIFVFYDGAGNPTAQVKSFTDPTITADFNNDNVTRFWSSVVPVEMTQGQNIPAYVMCYVNPIDKTNISTMTLSEVEATTRVRIKNDNSFAMSNSVYYGNNPISGQNNVRIMATPIIESKLFATEAEAKTAVNTPNSDGVVNIYVERYAAKIGLNLEPTAIKDYAVNVIALDGTSTEGAIKFTPTFWRPNAIDENTYVTKAFSTGNPNMDPTKPASFDELTEAFRESGMAGNGVNGWNDPDNFRSYWACSPSYYSNDYPKVSDNITDNANWETTFPYDLRYFTYNQIVNGITSSTNPADKGIAWNATTGFSAVPGNATTAASGYFYSRETTASIDNITSTDLNSKAVIASAVIVGSYKLTTAAADADATTFYLYGQKDGKPNYYATEAQVKEALLVNQSALFTDEACTNPVKTAPSFIVAHPAASVRVGENVPGRLVTLQLAAVPGTAIYFNNNGTIEAVDEDNIDAANKLLWKSVSTAQMFYNGLAFFSIPIRHLGYGNNLNGVELTSSADGASANVYNWENMRRGDFGVVRNHVYTLNVTEIKGLGTGLRDDDQPIVPPMDPENYYIAARLNVLAWRVVPAQGVIL